MLSVALWMGACRGESPETANEAPATRIAAGTSTAAMHPEPAPPPMPLAPPFLHARVAIASSLEAALSEAAGPEVGPALAQVVKRTMIWWANPSTDLRKGDTIEVVYETRPAEEPLVHAVWFTSQKLGRDFEAVRYQPNGVPFGRWYHPDGTEVELRLVGGPIEDYEQVTSLLSDGRKHKGVDFKTPVGTAIVSPFAGSVARVNWSFKANGNCVELMDGRGRRALFLHLSEIVPDIRAGTRVKAGQMIARSGNTGRSTAPHLHYQLQQGEKVLDPFQVHETRRARLPEGEIERLRARLAELSSLRKRS